MDSRHEATRGILGHVLGGLLANTNVLAGDDINGWSLCNTNEEQLCAYAVHIACRAENALEKVFGVYRYNPRRWRSMDEFDKTLTDNGRSVLVSTNNGAVEVARYQPVGRSRSFASARMGWYSPGYGEVTPVAWMELPLHVDKVASDE